MSDTESLKGGLLKLVRERGHVSFVEILREFPSQRGQMEMVLPAGTNIILWQGLSKELAQILDDMIEAGEVYVHPASELTYMIDGAYLKLPIAKSVRAYKSPRWLPATFHHTPYKKGKK